jgi:hypothetical protein
MVRTEQNQHSTSHHVLYFDLFTQIESSWKYNADKHKVYGRAFIYIT